jgi:hypothetical protein
MPGERYEIFSHKVKASGLVLNEKHESSRRLHTHMPWGDPSMAGSPNRVLSLRSKPGPDVTADRAHHNAEGTMRQLKIETFAN